MRRLSIAPMLMLLAAGCRGEQGDITRTSAKPGDFETVGIFFPTRVTTVKRALPGAPLSALGVSAIPFLDLERALEGIAPGMTASVVLPSPKVVLGARQFRPPSGPPPHLGGVRSEVVYAITLPNDATLDLAGHPKVERLRDGGAPRWTWHVAPQEGDPGPTRYYARRASNVLIVTNTVALLDADLSLAGVEELRAHHAVAMVLLRDLRPSRGEAQPHSSDLLKSVPDAASVVIRIDSELGATVEVATRHPVSSRTLDRLRAEGAMTGFTIAEPNRIRAVLAGTEGSDTMELMTAMGWLGFGVYL